jgi:hypothetical protein
MIKPMEERERGTENRSNALRRLRIFALILGASIFLWLPFEDTSRYWVILFAILICCWGSARFLVAYSGSSRFGLWIYPLCGALGGAAVTPTAIVLMIVKNGLHAHGPPDFTLDHIVSVILRTPVWLVGGSLIGTGIGLWQRSKLSQNKPDTA